MQRELAVILTCWVVIGRPSLASQNRAIKVLAREFVIHTTVAHVCLLLISSLTAFNRYGLINETTFF